MTYPIPKDAFDDRLAIVGTSGSGKTYLALGAIEHLFARKSRVIAVDPLGVMWGLRLCADGETQSPYQPVIFGGEHGDLPINEHAGALIGEAVATSRDSCIIDLSQFGTKASERRFMLAFLTALYRSTDREPVHLIIDEADMFAPQSVGGGDRDGEPAKLLGMMETVIRRGRVRGFIPWLISQRPAVLNKNVLSQADGLVAMKLTSSQDRDQLGDWVEGQADKGQWKALHAELATLGRGEAILWIPGRGILSRVTFPSKATFDSSRTPKRGEKVKAATLKPLDLTALRDKLGKVEAEAKANDPRALRAEIARLKAENVSHKPDRPSDVHLTHATYAKTLEQYQRSGYDRGWHEGWRTGWKNGHENGCEDQMKELERVALAFTPDAPTPPKAAKNIPENIPAELAQAFTPPERKQIPQSGNGHDDLTGPQRRVMASLAFWQSVGHEQPTRAQVAAVAGYSPSSGGFNNLVGGLNTAGKIGIPAAGRLSLASSYPGYSSGEAADKMLSVLSGPQRKIVEAALRYSRAASREEIATATEYSSSSGGFNNLIGSLCTLDILRKPSPGHVEISDWARKVLS